MQQNFNINWDHILFLYGFDHKNWLNIKSIYYHILSKFWINLPLMSKNLFNKILLIDVALMKLLMEIYIQKLDGKYKY